MSEKHFIEQKRYAESYLIPYLERHVPGFRGRRVLEVGCAEAGFLAALTGLGMRPAGLELESSRVDLSRTLHPGLDLTVGDITDPSVGRHFKAPFGVVVLRDVLEHVTDRKAALRNLRDLMEPGGYLYVTFPPRFSPFAGHHQNGRSLLRFWPWLHLLPASWIQSLGRMLGEYPHITQNAVLNFRIGLSIRAFERLIRDAGFHPVVRELFLFRPVYALRFGIPARHAWNLPVLREFWTFGCECLLARSD
ncbi:class I SAM-dependent methyltransferase [bacterium]|nr:class I SAM-dependent methyltransferase [bacterium]